MQALNRNDIPVGQALRPLPSSITYAATVDIRNVEREITEFMIRRACDEVECEQQFPFTGRKPKRIAQRRSIR